MKRLAALILDQIHLATPSTCWICDLQQIKSSEPQFAYLPIEDNYNTYPISNDVLISSWADACKVRRCSINGTVIIILCGLPGQQILQLVSFKNQKAFSACKIQSSMLSFEAWGLPRWSLTHPALCLYLLPHPLPAWSFIWGPLSTPQVIFLFMDVL